MSDSAAPADRQANVKKQVTWGTPAKTGEIVRFLPGGESIRQVAAAGGLPRGGQPCDCRFAADTTVHDRYIVRVWPPTGKLVPRWYAPLASTIDAALLAAGSAT